MRAIVTVIGKDHVGIIADVTALLAQYGVNVLDISQTVLQEYFTMIMLVDASQCTVPFADLARALDEAGATLTHILLTHGHYDHVGAVAALKKATGCKVYMDPVDAQGSQLLPLTPDVLTDNWPANDELTIDELTFKIYHTPGHTRGGVCLSCYGLLFSGDTLFAGSCGRTDFPGGSMQEMAKSLSLLAELPLPDATKVLPGHEGFSTLGQERSTNPYMNGAWY